MKSAPYLYQISASQGGLPKLPVSETWVSFQGLRCDSQRNTVVHGGPDRAICLYSFEAIEVLRREGHSIYPGASGENFTLAGLDWGKIQPGDRMKIGDKVQIELMSYCDPCRHNAQWFDKGNYRRIDQRQHAGWSRLYARVLTEGSVQQGDAVYLEELSEVKMS